MSALCFYCPICSRLKDSSDGFMVQMLKLEPVQHPVGEPMELMPGVFNPFQRVETVVSYKRRQVPMMVCRDCLPVGVEAVEL